MKKIIALLLALIMVLSLVACGAKTETPAEEPAETPAEEPAAEEPAEEPAEEEPAEEPAEKRDILVVGYSQFSQKFSPFFSVTAYDQDVWSMTALSLIGSDREGNLILNGIEGEVVPYNGTDYTYTGIADCEIVENEDGTVDYNFTMRDDIVFSDGEPMTADDAIFSMYVFCDPTYDGSSTLYGVPIVGIDEYRAGMSPLKDLIIADIYAEEPANADYYTEEQFNTYKAALDASLQQFAQDIVDYCLAAGLSADDYAGSDVACGMVNWGYGAMNDDGSFTDALGNTFSMADEANMPTIDTYVENLVTAYDYDLVTMSDTEAAGAGLFEMVDEALGDEAATYAAGVSTGDSAPNIEGIKKTGDYSFTVTTSKVDATAIYQLGVTVAPLHYYGDPAQYDYDNNQFGFTKGDLSGVKSKTTEPLGAGPYKFVSYENGVVTFEANENYFKGEPKIKNILFQETADADKLTGGYQGTFDITDPSFSQPVVESLQGYNSNGEITGDVITTVTVDNLGYGYIGINANLINVGGDPDSDASKDLRKGLATLLAVHRDTVIDSYYGDRASVIQYPISNTSWAAPKPADEGYQLAYSTDVDGNPIYTADMDEAAKYEAAIAAAKGFFEAAGYTFAEDGTATAPEGAATTFSVVIPADGSGDHPAYGILTATKDDLATLGITLEINDVSDQNILWDGLEAGTVEMWAAAWGATIDPDMYQVYHSSNVPENAGGSGSNNYHIQDAELDELMVEARSSTDQSFRKSVYKECLDIILDWACEIPTYQRQNALIFSTERVNMDTVTPDITTFWGWMNDIELLELN